MIRARRNVNKIKKLTTYPTSPTLVVCHDLHSTATFSSHKKPPTASFFKENQHTKIRKQPNALQYAKHQDMANHHRSVGETARKC